MYRVIHEPDRGQRVPIYLWAREVSPEALRQLKRIAAMPYVVDHVAAMADCHMAEGVAVGTVFATEHTVVPDALGGDLGCGMSALRFDLEAASLDRRTLEALIEAFGRAIPVGDDLHRGRGVPVPDALRAQPLSTGALDHARDRLSPRHLGTLGGGNHFVELDRDAAGWLWLLVHSGSRGLGAAVAGHHRRAADRGGPLGGLDLETDPGRAYLSDLGWALEFARANREAILARAAGVVAEFTGGMPDDGSKVDIHHNFAAVESHDGREVVVHRKGATCVPEGSVGLIPGSMGTATYLVRGRGAAAAFHSCSHGAGRVMSRREARERVRPAALEHAMRRVVFDRRRLGSLVEEAPAVYRDIREVLEDQRDLVDPLLRLEPIAVLKG